MLNLSRTYLAIVLVTLVGHTQVISQNTVTTKSVSELVADLGRAEFNVRERASSQLLDLGPQAVQSLKNLPAGLSKEARSRAASILEVLERRSLKEISQSFLVDPDIDNSHGLPAWHLFCEIVGGTRNAKLLYLDLLKSHSEIATQIQRIDSLKKSAQSTIEEEAKLIFLSATRSGQLLDKMHRRGSLDVGDSVAMLFAASAIEGTVPFEVSELIRSTSQLGFAGSINRSGFRPCLLQLLGRWIPKSPEAMASEVMKMGHLWDLKQVLPIARSHLSKSFDPFTREQAILCLVKFGDVSDVVGLLKYADDNTIIYQYQDMSNESNPIIESLGAPPGAKPSSVQSAFPVQKLVRVNDLAVAAAMILKQQDPRQVFPDFIPESFLAGSRSAISVLETEQKSRDDAIHTWMAQQPITEAPLAGEAPVPDSLP